MSIEIDKYIYDNNHDELFKQCDKENLPNLKLLLEKIYFKPSIEDTTDLINYTVEDIEIVGEITSPNESLHLLLNENKEIVSTNEVTNNKINLNEIKILLLCNWMSSKDLCNCWNKMSKGGGRWNNIKLISESDLIKPDYTVVINSTTSSILDLSKVIYFRMEPFMEKHKEKWGEWADPDRKKFKYAAFHDETYNNIEWHLSKTYTQLLTELIEKTKGDTLSTILSDKYSDIGHIKRVDFVKYLESKKLDVHVYGGNKFNWMDYKGVLPYHCKDNSLFPYKYSFNVENNFTNGYFTEKLIDGILAETLVFYCGCPNIRNYIDNRAYVWLELSNFEKDYQTIVNAIKGNLWEERLPFIKEAKKKILEEMSFFPRLEKILENK